MRRGFLYLVAKMDLHRRKLLAWRLSNTLEADFCVETLNDAISRYVPVPDARFSYRGEHVVTTLDRTCHVTGYP